MTRVIRLAVGSAVILFAGAVLAQPPKDVAGGYFPIKPGTKWTYKTGDQTVEVRVSDKTVKFNNEDCYQFETSVGGKVVATELYAVKADGIYRTKVKDDKVDPPIKVLSIPVKAGDSWKFDSKVGTQKVVGEFKVKGDKEKVKVPAGDFEAVEVDGIDLDVAGAKTTVKVWFAKDKGIVKLYYKIAEAETTLEMSEFKSP